MPSCKQGCSLPFVVLNLGLCHGNVVDEEADTTLRDHVRHTIPELDADNGLCATDVQEREEVRDRVKAPRDDCRHTDLAQHAGNRWFGFLVNGILQANKQLVDDEEEHGEREAKTHKAEGDISLDDKLLLNDGGCCLMTAAVA